MSYAEECREAGASEAFIEVIENYPESGFARKAAVDLEEWGRIYEGGHTFNALWRGDVIEAYWNADSTNQEAIVGTYPDVERLAKAKAGW